MDDDDRTRRASFLLWNLTAALLVIGVMTIIVLQLVHRASWYAGLGAGLGSVIVFLVRMRRIRACGGSSGSAGPAGLFFISTELSGRACRR
jgi:uncharacterized membrane protein YhaH (DUF805 family)